MEEIKQLPNSELFKLIAPHTEFVVMVPWYGKPIPVTLRMPDSVALDSCGDFNTVSKVIADSDEDKIARDDLIRIKNIHENILKASLVRPTFEEFMDFLVEQDFYKTRKKKIAELEELIDQLKSQEKKNKYMLELENIELSIAFLFPEDFTGTIVHIILQNDRSDIFKLTRNMLLQAGFMGEKYSIPPSNYLNGLFTEKQKKDIDATATILVAEYREMQKTEKSSMRWIRGKGGKKT